MRGSSSNKASYELIVFSVENSVPSNGEFGGDVTGDFVGDDVVGTVGELMGLFVGLPVGADVVGDGFKAVTHCLYHSLPLHSSDEYPTPSLQHPSTSFVQAPSRGIQLLDSAPFGSHVLSPADPHARHFSLVSPHQVASQVLKLREQQPFEPVGAGVTGALVTGAGFVTLGAVVLEGDFVGGDVVGPP